MFLRLVILFNEIVIGHLLQCFRCTSTVNEFIKSYIKIIHVKLQPVLSFIFPLSPPEENFISILENGNIILFNLWMVCIAIDLFEENLIQQPVIVITVIHSNRLNQIFGTSNLLNEGLSCFDKQITLSSIDCLNDLNKLSFDLEQTDKVIRSISNPSIFIK